MNQYNSKNIVVIPTYNEASNIERLVLDLLNEKLSVLVVDDNSPIALLILLKFTSKIQERFSDSKANKLGYGSAYERFSFAPKRLIQLFKWMQIFRMFKDWNWCSNIGKDIVIGSRYVMGKHKNGYFLGDIVTANNL